MSLWRDRLYQRALIELREARNALAEAERELNAIRDDLAVIDTVTSVGDAQARAIDDAVVHWREAQGALDAAQKEAENLHDAKPQLLTDDTFYEFLGAVGGMQRFLGDLIDDYTEMLAGAS